MGNLGGDTSPAMGRWISIWKKQIDIGNEEENEEEEMGKKKRGRTRGGKNGGQRRTEKTKDRGTAFLWTIFIHKKT